jgi:hypothetical protein
MSEAYVPKSEDIQKYPWNELATGVEDPSAFLVASAFFSEATRLEELGDTEGAHFYRFLGRILRVPFNLEDKDYPLGISEDVTSNEEPAVVKLIEELAVASKVPILSARFADTVRTLNKANHQMAKLAATAYLEAYKKVDQDGHWSHCLNELERGMGIARTLGTKKETYTAYVEFADQRIDELEETCKDAQVLWLGRLLLEQKVGNMPRLAEVCERMGDKLNEVRDGDLTRDYYDLSARAFAKHGRQDEASRVGIKKASSFENHAERFLSNPENGYIRASHFLANAIICYQQSGGSPEHIKKLNKKLIAWQQHIPSEMKTFSAELDATEFAEKSKALVRGFPYREAIARFALGHPIVDVNRLRERTIRSMREFPLTTLFGSSRLSNDSRVIAHAPGGWAGQDTLAEAAIEPTMYEQACSRDWSYRAQIYIENCRNQIMSEHQLRTRDLEYLVTHSHFVAPGHGTLFMKGIMAGFRGEFDVAAHLLVPQFEPSIRHVLTLAGHVTSKLDAKLIQEQRLLGTLLSMPETVEIFGDDLIFELRGILCERLGYDLRNRLAHGFMHTAEFYNVDTINMWWLAIRLLHLPIFSFEPDGDAESEIDISKASVAPDHNSKPQT